MWVFHLVLIQGSPNTCDKGFVAEVEFFSLTGVTWSVQKSTMLGEREEGIAIFVRLFFDNRKKMEFSQPKAN